MADLIDAFKCHSRCQSSVTNKRDYVEIFILQVAGRGDA